MAKYNYDEAGNMAAYFLITFVALVVVPLTFTSFGPFNKTLPGCTCSACAKQRKRIKLASRSWRINIRFFFIFAGWSLLAYLSYKIANANIENKVYDPFEILGIRTGSSEKEIKSHYKKLSKIFHPDKVRATANNTVEEIQNRFVNLTKAYKALTDDAIRENIEKYGHPDGRQDVSMGIALPKWIVEGKNNVWVLGIYGIVFGGALPFLVGRWWFGSRQKTKDGIHALSAASYFKTLKEDSTFEEVLGTFCMAFKWENRWKRAITNSDLDYVEQKIKSKSSATWSVVKKFCGDDLSVRRGLLFIYAHLFRIPLTQQHLLKEQMDLLLQTPLLLNALLNISVARNWWIPTQTIMKLHAYLVQAVLPSSEHSALIQLPCITVDDLSTSASDVDDLWDVYNSLEEKQDDRAVEVKKVIQKWGRVEIVEATFKVIGDRIITPSSIVFLVIGLRLRSPSSMKLNNQLLKSEENIFSRLDDEGVEDFLVSRKEAEDISSNHLVIDAAHAPFWPTDRKPSWWLVLADEKSNRIVVPPMRISDIPFSQSNCSRDFRTYKIQFQAPQTVGAFTWKVHVISDSFVGEDISRDITLRIEDSATLNTEESLEDEISDPEEDTIAGQMAAMRGERIKKSRTKEDEESDEESSTDDDEDTNSSSDSD